MVVFALVIQVPARLGGGQAVGVLGAEAEAAFCAAVGDAEGEAGGAGEEGYEGGAEGEGEGEAVG